MGKRGKRTSTKQEEIDTTRILHPFGVRIADDLK